jgi:hypothetical protein
VQGVLPLTRKRSKREADHSLPSTAKVKNTWSHNSAPSLPYSSNCVEFSKVGRSIQTTQTIVCVRNEPPDVGNMSALNCGAFSDSSYLVSEFWGGEGGGGAQELIAILTSYARKCLCIYSVCVYTVELGYNIMKGTGYFLILNECCYNRAMVNSEELIGTTEYLML